MRRLPLRPAGAPRALALALLFAGAALPLAAGTARLATTAGGKELLAGEALGTAVTADGRLTLGEPLGSRAWPEDAADAVPFAAASDRSGRVYVATGGGQGRVYVSTSDGKVALFWTAPEPNVTALAFAPDGALVCGTSPKGKLYRVDAKGNGTAIGDPGESAIWAIAFSPDGTLYAGTGNKGRIYKLVRDSGKAQLFAEIDDVHIRSLLVAKDGRVIAGSSERGLLVAFTPAGVARTLHDFSRPEVVAIAEGADGILYAAATNAEAPSLADARGRGPAAAPPTAPAPGPASAPPKPDETPRGTVSVSTGPARLAPAPAAKESTGGAEVVAVAPDGLVEPAWVFPDETIFSMRFDAARGLVLTTGPRGRVYVWKDRHVRLEAQTEQKQAVAAPPVGSSFAVVTMNAPGVVRPASAPRAGTYTAASRDAVRMSRFTRLRYEGTVPSGASLAFAVRAGNAEKPDATWTPWTPLEGDARKGASASLPAARFFQWKATLSASPSGAAPVVEKVELAYTERNARPVLENLAVLEPGAVYQRGGGGGTAVLSVTNPDENGIFAGLEPEREAGGPGKKLWRKGYRTITWKGTDPNGDSLRYDVDARREGSTAWFPVRKDLEDTWLSFDSAALPDGRYRFRITASDRISNPEGEELTAQDESPVALVDNTPPVLTVVSTKREGADVVVTFTASDALSPVTKAEAAVNADRWRPLVPEDGAADTPSERYVFRTKKPDGPTVLAFRVVDASGNSSAAQVDVP